MIILNDTNRITFDILRHAPPEKDPTTGRSLDKLTPEGYEDSKEKGKLYQIENHGLVSIYFSPKERAKETINGLVEGMLAEDSGSVPRTIHINCDTDPDLGLKFIEGKELPKGVYNAGWIEKLITNYQGIEKIAQTEINRFIGSKYTNLLKSSSNNRQNPLIIAVSHAPKVEFAYAGLIGQTENIGNLAAEPLGGFSLSIDTKERSGNIVLVQINYTPQKFQTFQEGKYNTLDTEKFREFVGI